MKTISADGVLTFEAGVPCLRVIDVEKLRVGDALTLFHPPRPVVRCPGCGRPGFLDGGEYVHEFTVRWDGSVLSVAGDIDCVCCEPVPGPRG